MKLLVLTLLVASAFCAATADPVDDGIQWIKDLQKRAQEDPAGLAKELRESPMAAIVNWEERNLTTRVGAAELPIVAAHGMGDSCFNSGMKSITADLAKHLGVYGVCVPTGDNFLSDTINGFLMNMDKSVDVFAKKIQADPNLKGGFNAIGFSQGNSLIRGYIQKYNDPPVNTFISVHGTVMGVAGFPQCNPGSGGICKGLAGLLGDLAYNSFVQGILFQADYFREAGDVNSTGYLTHSQIADWNNEGATPNSEYNKNFAKTNQFVMVKAEGDTMVFPNDGEWWGQYSDGTYTTKLQMKDTRLYKEDLFGLRTADEAGKIHFESTTGNHLQFTEEQLLGWADKYL